LDRQARTGWVLATVLVAVGGALCASPAGLQERVRCLVLDVLKPGMSMIAALNERSTGAGEVAGLSDPDARQLEQRLKAAERETRQLAAECARLEKELEHLRSEKPAPFVGETGLPLFAPDLLTARVLTRPADGAVEKAVMTLSEGTAANVALAEWVLAADGTTTIDQGEHSRVSADDSVLAGRAVFGRVASVGRFTSRVQHVSDTAFRAHARLVRRHASSRVLGAEGLLVGTGNGKCALELVPATEPVEPGDLVMTAGDVPGLDDALSLGEVERAELHAGAVHWTITVKPAVATDEAGRVQVLRVGLHPGREPLETAGHQTAGRRLEKSR
jgi:rod shape-determining protein MreC